MIHFFKGIRRGLIKKNLAGKYLLYAIGEILLVVIGILIALQIDNWNEERKQALSVRESLISLKEEIEYNANFLNYLTLARNDAEKKLSAYLHLITDPSIPLKERAEAELPDLFYRDLRPRVSIANSLEYTGLINNIANDSLKKYIIVVRNDYSNLANRERTYYERTQELQGFVSKRQYRKIVDSNIPGEWNMYYPNDMGKDLSVYKEKYINDIEYYNLIASCIGLLHVQVQVGYGILFKLEKILDELDKETAALDEI